ncbi:glycoside hydrolase family 97 protein [Arachidicoccus ginsenosidimutans]|uniref:glycoside hydrolase family 97 protein n=1 Tax=Arachidicoccus sp. BS20 TaxID=1850526 RepID=UPI001E38DCF5|nr:glycoside hydrolase family 97 protein [Arachidicoccus sp. BS20]
MPEKLKLFALIASCLFVLQNTKAQQTFTLSSPDNHVKVHLYNKDQHLHYTLSCNDSLISDNTFAFQLGGKTYGQNIQSIQLLNKERIKRSFDVRGVHNTAKTDKQVYRLSILSTDKTRDFLLIFNVYDNGIAVCYNVAHHHNVLEKDLSNIDFPENVTYWWQGDVADYEGNYSASHIKDLRDSQKIGMPLTVSYTGGMFAAVMEANLHNFAGSHLTYNNERQAFDYTLAGSVKPVTEDTLKSPWRIIVIGRDLNTLVNNDIVSDVSPAPDKKLYPQGLHTSWIKPGVSVWSWMSNKRDVTPENMKQFTDYAAQLKIPYNLIDDGWSGWKEDGKDMWALLQEQVDYAKNKGVGIWVWKAYVDYRNTPGLKDSTYMESFFRHCAKIGVKGLKIDFIDSEHQPEIAFYERAARLAAKYHLMVDFHGADKATGLEYTYPNVLSQEGVRGLEQEDRVNWPFHNTVLPFTRYLSGPADFTPMSFRSFVHTTTLAHQAATVALYTSPFLCLGVDPGDLLKSEALLFIKNMPAIWDETIVLNQSQIGKAAVFARRKNNNWYLAITNGEMPTTLDLKLNFLPADIDFTLQALSDTKNNRESKMVILQHINKQTVLHIEMPSGGGYLGVIRVRK